MLKSVKTPLSIGWIRQRLSELLTMNRRRLTVPKPSRQFGGHKLQKRWVLIHGEMIASHICDQKKSDIELARQREVEKAARSYDTLFNVEETEDVPRKSVRELEEDFMWSFDIQHDNKQSNPRLFPSNSPSLLSYLVWFTIRPSCLNPKPGSHLIDGLITKSHFENSFI